MPGSCSRSSAPFDVERQHEADIHFLWAPLRGVRLPWAWRDHRRRPSQAGARPRPQDLRNGRLSSLPDPPDVYLGSKEHRDDCQQPRAAHVTGTAADRHGTRHLWLRIDPPVFLSSGRGETAEIVIGPHSEGDVPWPKQRFPTSVYVYLPRSDGGHRRYSIRKTSNSWRGQRSTRCTPMRASRARIHDAVLSTRKRQRCIPKEAPFDIS